ncbi:terpenoid synthase [Coniophora puteana RWD-64-598 SS2]|uniref:Terpene synthase n=1 Tax=Coniophora puteana (strain RWD-64-598) TaxID=741705 RepID=A0A5M3MLY0_CONPW|nr:terpenoid synthase [Coniophora puteana RWD-64-598 SS2]EIW80046.1 terpenoid synthase [Coniophora puteana RWD-64-598 SS2]
MPPFIFPPYFALDDLCAITGKACKLKVNPLQNEANTFACQWFDSIGVCDEAWKIKFLNLGKFDLFAALSFPDADLKHLETCLMFFFWAFSTDDLSDEGAFQDSPSQVQAGHDISNAVIDSSLAMDRPSFPYAAMLYEYVHKLPSVEEFILMRRATIGGAMVEAMVEYSLDIDLPDYVFEHSTIRAMSDATNDMMTWPNDLCSFNKEQANGDYQNLVFVIMNERRVDLQEAIDILTDMLSQRVDDYLALKASLPSFGSKVDHELSRYIEALEYFTQGTVLWYYLSPSTSYAALRLMLLRGSS